MATYNAFRSSLFFFVFFLSQTCLSSNLSEISLPNGLKIITLEDHRYPVAIVNFVYHVGSIDEQRDQTGISHLLQHLMYGSTKNISHTQLKAFFNQHSGHHHAYNTHENTVYSTKIQPQDLTKVLQLERDRLTQLRITDAAFEKEKAMVLQEQTTLFDQQRTQHILDQFKTIAFSTGGYHNPVTGWITDIEKLTAQQVKHWYHTWYTPNNLTIIIAGDINPTYVKDNIVHLFGGIDKAKQPTRYTPEKSPRQGELRLDRIEAVKNKLYLIGYMLPKPDKLSLKTEVMLHLIDDILLNPDQGILARKLIKDLHIATSIHSDIDYLKQVSGYFYFLITPNENIHFYSIKQKINSVITQLTEADISTERLNAAKRKLLAKHIYSHDNLDKQVDQIAKLDSIGLPIDRYLKLETVTQEITSADIIQLIQRYFCEKCHKAILTIKPL